MLRVAFSLLALALVACGDEFEDRCSEVCPAEPVTCPQGQVDCTATCAEQARTAEPYACDQQAVTYWGCVAGADLCATTVPADCADEFAAFYDCLASFCESNPADPACGQGQGGGAS